MAQPILANTSGTAFDAVIIGAGINGAGIARDAAMRGLKVLLLDKGDIAGGTSSWSTRLIHGGLRYLEHGEIGLVRESLRERETLLRIAPHLVRPLPILIPIYKHARRGIWTMRAGMFAYDILSSAKSVPAYQMLSREQTLERTPALESEGLLGAAIYYDAQVEFAERLVLENALSAVEYGAEVITYARVDEFTSAEGGVCGVMFTNELTGETGTVEGRVLINAAGPWVDEVLTKHVGANAQRLIGGTKGSHIVVAPFPGAPDVAVYVEAKTDQRPFFIIPWNGNYLIGTTDIRYQGDLDRVLIDDEEIYYLLRETNAVLPAANLDRAKILYSYSGVRPLPFTGDKNAQRITRRHFIRQHPEQQNVLSIVGGKLTTYRSLAAEALELVFKKLKRPLPECRTDRVVLPGAAPDFLTFSKEFKRTCGLAEATTERLLRIYGTRAADVSELVAMDPSLDSVFDVETGAIAAEVVHAFRNELAQTLSDCLLRRTMVGLNSARGLDALEAAAAIAQKHLGWSEQRARDEVGIYRKYVERFIPSVFESSESPKRSTNHTNLH
jgi:glycerol-3-phosphate dehydrogenase